MNDIVMIPVGQLHHHPENPRLDLGDLTELAESIKANGVMQNLTVVRGHRMSREEWTEAAKAEGVSKDAAAGTYNPEEAWSADGYTVVIGNRRMEASKLAGVAEVPCVISDMDHRTQVSTMLMENMQRADLTVYEQAQGFQMMDPRDVEISGVDWHLLTLARRDAPQLAFAYTFFNQDGFRTSSHVRRIFRDVIDRSFRRRIDRWAMVTVTSSDAGRGRLVRFLSCLKEVVE